MIFFVSLVSLCTKKTPARVINQLLPLGEAGWGFFGEAGRSFLLLFLLLLIFSILSDLTLAYVCQTVVLIVL